MTLREDPGQHADRSELGLRPRLMAAGWFALTALVPIVGFFGAIGRLFYFGPEAAKDPMLASIFIAVPVAMAAFFGFVFGSRILNKGIVIQGRKAAIHGVLVAVYSYVGFIFAYAVIIASNTPKQLVEIMASMLMVFAYGALLVGWLIVLAGAFSGWLLFSFSYHSSPGTWTNKSTARRLDYWAGAVLLLVLVVCWLPVRSRYQHKAAEQAHRDLTEAVWRNDPSRVQELLEAGLSVETQDVAGATLLATAAEMGHTRIIKMLLDRGADPNVTSTRNDRRTPLHWAAVNADFNSVRALLDHGAMIDARDANGRTPLMEAAWATDRETVKFLIERGADVSYQSPDGQTALSFAKSRRDNTPTKLDRSEGTINQGSDAGQNIIDSRDFDKPDIMKRSRARHDAIIDLLESYVAR